MPFFLGIDGGGTKTRCVIGDEKSELGVATSSSSKVQRVGEACARDALAGAADREDLVSAGRLHQRLFYRATDVPPVGFQREVSKGPGSDDDRDERGGVPGPG